MASEFSAGFETGDPETAFDDIQGASGTMSLATDFPASGQGCLLINSVDQYGFKALAANAIKVAHFRIRVTTFAPAGPSDVLRFQNAAATNSAAISVESDAGRRLVFNHTFGGTELDLFGPLQPNSYYRVEFIVNATSNPWSMSWTVDGVAQGTFAPAQAGTTWDRVFIGYLGGSPTPNLRIDDVFTFSGSAGDYPPGDLRDYGGGPMAGGTPQRAGGGGRW